MTRRILLAVLSFAALAAQAPAVHADESSTWKLVVLAYGEDEFLIVKVTPAEDGTLKSEVLDSQSFLAPCSVGSISHQGEDVTATFETSSGPSVFRGKQSAPGETMLGTLVFRDTTYPARVEKTDATKVAPISQGEIPREVGAARQVGDPKERAEKLRDLLSKHKDEAASYHIHNELVRAAVAGEAPEAEIRTLLDAWTAGAKPYGEPWVAETRTNALKALAGKKPYAALAKELAVEADKATGEDAPVKQRAAIVALLAAAADLSGDEALAKSARERSERLEAMLDEEYRAKVPPFKPESFAGRGDAGSDRVAVFELFTGAQCPPCVAADVAFDALMTTYKPTDLIGLQYHLHIPGPDPLTNADTVERSNYYQARSTPTVMLNGQPLPEGSRGGGPMARAEAKYGQYRKLIDEQLEGPKKATIDLKASREGDSIRIVADASAEAAEGAKPRLRLVLTEESIRYVGGNGLRFHHHVVRALPGGAEGKELVDGKAHQDVAVTLDEIRAGIESYLSDFEKSRPFPFALPAVDLKDLSVVALVQDDADKAIWHAVQVPIGPAR